MPDDADLYPPVALISRRLTELHRERRRLEALRGLAAQAESDRQEYGRTAPPRAHSNRRQKGDQ
jgi:hypothetical protein